jgi:CubicO group peptidase (beta-lactamase class C family)
VVSPLALEQHVRRAVHDRVAPAVAFGLSVGDAAPLLLRGGRLTHLPDAAPLEADTPFDLASLTKPLTTVTWVLRLVTQGRLDLEAPIGRFIAVTDTRLAETPVWRLLSHTTGLPAHREYFRGLLPRARATGDFAGARATVSRMVTGTLLEAAPGARETYSDLGFLLLERVAEAVDAPLAQAWRTLPLHGEGVLHFRPVGQPDRHPPDAVCAATELCPLRGRLVQGEVHDENAWVCGGVAGHAGLFGRLVDVVDFGRAVVAGWHGTEDRLGISREVWRMATAARWLHPAGTRVLGWDTPSPGQSTAGRFFGPDTIGHLGFTGTSLWIDLPRAVVMVLLTNRVCPTRSNTGIRALRPAMHDAAWDAVAERGGHV